MVHCVVNFLLFFFYLYRIRLRRDRKFVLGEEKADEVVRLVITQNCYTEKLHTV